MAYRKAEPLFASPRGNAVMKAKRVTGESANTILTRHVVLEKCGKCKERASVTWNYTGTHKVRSCMECMEGKAHREHKVSRTVALLGMEFDYATLVKEG